MVNVMIFIIHLCSNKTSLDFIHFVTSDGNQGLSNQTFFYIK